MTPDAANIPTSKKALRDLVRKQRSQIKQLHADNKELVAKALKFQDLYFGRSSEKTRPSGDSDERRQIPLFQAELLAEAQAAAEANNVSGSISSTPGKPRRKGGPRSKFPSHLPRVETKYELKDDDKVCGCGCEMHLVGFETSKELERIETRSCTRSSARSTRAGIVAPR